MNLLFRMIGVVLAGWFGRRFGFLGESRLHLRVWPTDLDVNLHMTNARYFSVMDLGRLDLLVRGGVVALLWRRRWQPVLGAATVRFRRPLRPFRRFTLISRVLCWDDKWIYIEHRIATGTTTAALAVVRGAFVGPGGTVSPAEVLRALGERVDSPPMPDHVAAWRDQSLPLDAPLAAE
ncbi:thioesterase family protein [Azospirillum halopraeferens]|uniref:thioesterase family protein n=1 Tax=Azospirillum halopraeferens TaxID=34010 RepID=UPI0004057D98|nr:thioesterase family protein [Azospirillum halopraeferens]